LSNTRFSVASLPNGACPTAWRHTNPVKAIAAASATNHGGKRRGVATTSSGAVAARGAPREFRKREEAGVQLAAEAELCDHPERDARREDRRPAVADSVNQQHRTHRHEQDVHRQDIEQRRVVDQQQTARESPDRVLPVVDEQVVDGRLLSPTSDQRDDREQECEQDRLPRVNLEDAAEERPAHLLLAGTLVARHVDPAGQEGGDQDEAFGGRNEAEGLAERGGEAGREVGDGHEDEHEPAQRVELGRALGARGSGQRGCGRAHANDLAQCGPASGK
jgi:hypothetical protein